MIERRTDDAIIITPATCKSHGWRVTVVCGVCAASRRITCDYRFAAVWDSDWADVFATRVFRCRCEGRADILRVERERQAGFDEILVLERE